MKPRRWQETRNTLTHKQSAHRATHEVVEIRSWEGRGDQKDGPWFWPLTRQIREYETLNTNTDLSKSPLCLIPTFQISRCQDLVQKQTQMR